jgi:uncharacterized membrane protein YgaE (UPF0421/DUF939 family)
MMETVLRRWAYSVWPIAQQAAAAVIAWMIAVRFAGHSDPFFAPIAAIVGLNVTLGRRGSNAIRLLIGVVVGIAVAELVVESGGGGVWTLALATFFAMLIARAVDDQPIVVAQAAVSAVLITTFPSQEQGWERLVDALIGVGVALVFSQLLFVPEPLRLLRRAESAVLSSLADGLWLIADALEHTSHQLADQATRQLRTLRDNLVALNTVRTASARIVRHSLTWRRRAASVAVEQERADRLDLVVGSGIMLARTAMAATDQERLSPAPAIRHLANGSLIWHGTPRSSRPTTCRRSSTRPCLLAQGASRGRTGAVSIGCRVRRRPDDRDRRHDLRWNGTGAGTPRRSSRP